MKKKLFLILMVCVIATCSFMLVACDDKAGKSAYEIAVEHGFEGTENEWLDSLKGVDGTDGRNGTNGQNGTDGKDNEMTVSDYYAFAVANGYTGSELDFVKDYLKIGYASDDRHTVAKNLLSSVSIVCGFQVTTYNIIGNPFVGWSYDTKNPVINTEYSAGSGVIYKLDKENGSAFIITNYHVVYNENADEGMKVSKAISVYLYGGASSGQELQATYVGGSMTYDIAVLRIENSEILKNSDAEAVTIADSNKVVVGQKAIAIGNAKGEGISVTSGIVSVDSETIEMTGADEKTSIRFRVMRIDCAVNSGNSGGGLFDAEGNLIGIVNAKIITSGVENIGYALPANVVKYVAENIIEGDGIVRKCQLGVTVVSNEPKAVFDTERGVVNIIESVTVYEDETAKISEDALVYGKLQSGDVIKTVKIDKGGDGVVDGTYEINRSFILVDVMLMMREGDKLTIEIERADEESGEKSNLEFTFEMTDKCIAEIQ